MSKWMNELRAAVGGEGEVITDTETLRTQYSHDKSSHAVTTTPPTGFPQVRIGILVRVLGGSLTGFGLVRLQLDRLG